jgi:hypothetical protein
MSGCLSVYGQSLFQDKPQDDGTGPGLGWAGAGRSTDDLLANCGWKEGREEKRRLFLCSVRSTLIQVETLHFYGPEVANVV